MYLTMNATGLVYTGTWFNTVIILKKVIAERFTDQFAAEINLLRGLTHPNIVRFLGIYPSGRISIIYRYQIINNNQ